MMVRIASEGDIRFVFNRLPAERAAEMTASAFHDDASVLAEELVTIRAVKGDLAPVFALCNHAGALLYPPSAIVGVIPFGPSLGGMVWAATEKWPSIAMASHRWWRSHFIGILLKKHYRRVEFTALASDTASRRWLKVLGFTEEGTAYRQGKRGEDFIHCAWLNPDRTVGIHA